MSKPIELIIFDCDGVVIESEIISAQVLIEKLAEFGVDIDVAYVQQHFLGCNFASVKQKIKENLHTELPESFEEYYRSALLTEFERLLNLTDGFGQMLSTLSVPYCIATSSSAKRTAKALSVVGLTESFGSNIFTAEEVVNGKPAPDLFLHAAKSMGFTPEQCLVFEDSFFGVTAAIRAEMSVVHYKGGKHISATADKTASDDNADKTASDDNAENSVAKQYPNVPVLNHWRDFASLPFNFCKA